MAESVNIVARHHTVNAMVRMRRRHMVLLLKCFSALRVLILEERLDVDIALDHLLDGMRLRGNFLTCLVLLDVPVFSVLVINFMNFVLLLIVTVSSMLMEGHWLLFVSVITVLFSEGGLEALALLGEPGEVSRLTLLMLLVLSNGVSIGGGPS